MKPLLFALALTGFSLTGGASAVFAAPALPPIPKAGTPAPAVKTAPAATAPVATAPVAMAPAPASGVAADVNGEKITVVELNRRMDAVKASEPAFRSNTPAATQALQQLRGQMLDELVTIKLLTQEAKRRRIVAPTKDVEDAMAQLKAQFKTDAEFNSWLAQSGVTQTEVRARLSNELVMDELTNQQISDVTVSDADIAQFYREHPDDFTIQPAVKARHILLAVNPNASASDKDAVRKRAQNLIAQLKKGGDFAALAKSNSDDKSNADRGGELPVFERGMMVKPFEDAAFAAKAGDIVGPVETEYGMHIIKIDKVLPKTVVELKEVKEDPRLRAVILRDKKQARFDAFIAGLKASAKIQKFV